MNRPVFHLGDKVKVASVYRWPTGEEVVDADSDEVAARAVPNPLADQIGVVIGVSRRSTIAELVGPGSDPDAILPYLDWKGGKRSTYLCGRESFYAIRYTLRGRRYYAKPEDMELAEEVRS